MGADAERVTVFGVATPYAWEVVETLWRLGRDPVCVDNHGGADPGLPGLNGELTDPARDVAVGPSSPPARARAAGLARAAGARNMPALVDPTAVVARTARLAHGSYVSRISWGCSPTPTSSSRATATSTSTASSCSFRPTWPTPRRSRGTWPSRGATPRA